MKQVLQNATVYKEKVDYRDKNTGEKKDFYVWKVAVKTKSNDVLNIKIVPNKDQVEILENLGYETKEVE